MKKYTNEFKKHLKEMEMTVSQFENSDDAFFVAKVFFQNGGKAIHVEVPKKSKWTRAAEAAIAKEEGKVR